jgi:hypothetical protein
MRTSVIYSGDVADLLITTGTSVDQIQYNVQCRNMNGGGVIALRCSIGVGVQGPADIIVFRASGTRVATRRLSNLARLLFGEISDVSHSCSTVHAGFSQNDRQYVHLLCFSRGLRLEESSHFLSLHHHIELH